MGILRFIRKVSPFTAKTGQTTYRVCLPLEIAKAEGIVRGTWEYDPENRTFYLDVREL